MRNTLNTIFLSECCMSCLDVSVVWAVALLSFFLLAAAWVDPGRSALQSAEQWCKERYGRIHQVGKMSFYDNFMTKTCRRPLKQHTKQKGTERGNRPQKVPRLQKKAPVMSVRQPLCRRRSNNIGRRWLW